MLEALKVPKWKENDRGVGVVGSKLKCIRERGRERKC